MKSKIALLAIATIVSVSAAGVAHAQIAGVQANADIEAGTQVNINHNNLNAQASTSATVRGNATSTAARNKHASSTVNTNGKNMSAIHRSIVAAFVHSLLAVADREGGIGAQVRTVAQSQNDSASTTVTALTKVEGRGSFHTFLTGSDYKNLGVIRSEMATTSANLTKLRILLSKAASEADRTELNAQSKALEDEQVKVQAYVKTDESKFSLFGWFRRLFIK